MREQHLKNEILVTLTMMSDSECLVLGLSELTQDCFTDLEMQRVFAVLRDMQSSGRQPTIANTNYPQHYYETGVVDGILEMNPFLATCKELSNWKLCRELIGIAETIKGISNSGNFAKAFNYGLDLISSLQIKDSDRLSFKTWEHGAQLAEERFIKLRNGEGGDFFIPSGYRCIDEYYTGLPVGALVGIAAGSGVGKSTTVLPTILANLDKEIFVASTEVSPQGLSANVGAVASKLYRSDITKGKLNDKASEKYIDTLRTIIAKIKGGVTMQRKLSRIIAEMKIWRGKTDISKPAIVIVDFLNDIVDEYGRVYRYADNIPSAVSQLKGLGQELNVTMIVLSQFNREQKKDKDKRPESSYIIGSEAFFQSADVIILPHRPVMYLSPEEKVYFEGERYEDAIMIVEKFKDNPIKDFNVIFDSCVTQFIDVEMRAEKIFGTENGTMLKPVSAAMLNTEHKQSKTPF